MNDAAKRRRNGRPNGPAHPGPSLHGIPFLQHAGGGAVDLLSHPQRERLAGLATVEHFPARTIVYRAGAPAAAVYIISHGAVKAFRDLPSGRRRIAAFHFDHDLFGLAENGRYVNTLQTMSPTTLYRLDVTALADAFRLDAELELRFLCKAVHELREAQHHAIIIGRRHAAGRVAMLLRLLEQQSGDPSAGDGVLIPMSRSDMADYLGLSLESVVRASRRLERQGIVDFMDRHHARVLDRRRFNELASAA